MSYKPLLSAQRAAGPGQQVAIEWIAGLCTRPGATWLPGFLLSIRDAPLSYFPCRSFKRSDPVNPYHVGSGYVFAPATSANDSEISSDALTDDSMSMTDSSV